ncbi:MAG: hydroxyacylglutathione hydrolase [Pseudomonadota bacterium]
MLDISAIPAFRDNYIWAVRDLHRDPSATVLVDPGEPGAILTWLASQQARPLAILVTHHHGDHTGALAALGERWRVPVYGPRRERIAGVTHPVGEGDEVELPELGLRLAVMETPGHTLGHVCYVGDGLAFTGDTLFSCGCGRLFEGTAAQMHESLRRLAALPEDTRVYCAHEYTLPNIGFALEVEPDNPALLARHEAARQARKAGLPTLPSTIGQERAANPFLRCHLPAVQVAISQHQGLSVNGAMEAFAALRRWKDDY